MDQSPPVAMESNVESSEKLQPVDRSRAYGIILIVVFIVLMGVGCFVNIAYQQIQNKKVLTSLQQENQVLTQQVNALQKSYEQQNQMITSHQAAIGELMDVIRSPESAWLKKQAVSLIRQADLQLRLNLDKNNAQALLEAADHELQSLQDEWTITVRRELAQSLVALRAVPSVDTIGIYMKLQALNAKLNQLPLETLSTLNLLSSSDQSPTLTGPWWKRGAQSMKDVLKKAVIIQRREQPVLPLLEVQERAFINLTLQELFAEAEWAVLQQQSKIYEANLQAIQSMTQQYFLQTNPDMQSVKEGLQALLTTPIAYSLPTLDLLIALSQAPESFTTTLPAPTPPAIDARLESRL
jgi:uroporphyrin-3 C-methyltransferase